MKKKESNKEYPKGSICETYIVKEISMFCSFYFEEDIPTPFNRFLQNDDGGPRGRLGCQSIFSHVGWEMPPNDDFRTLEDEELHIAHSCVFLNCEEIGPYLE